MSAELLCTSWSIQLPEPTSADPVDRIRAQEEYLGQRVAPWLMDARPAWTGSLHSFHFMRYLDPTHLARVKGIAIELRLLGRAEVLTQAEPEVDATLSEHKTHHIVMEYLRKPRSDWRQTTLDAYGGPQAGHSFAHFLASDSWLTLHLLHEPSFDVQSRSLVLDNWGHCFGLVTKCKG